MLEFTLNFLFSVLDEADRILDMGFADTMNAIIENLPKKRQTLLFSATQTKSVKDLARLSLKNPEYVWVHEKAKYRYVLFETMFDLIKKNHYSFCIRIRHFKLILLFLGN